MKRANLSAVLFIALFAQWSFAAPSPKVPDTDAWTSAFDDEKEFLVSTGRNPFFVLEPGYRLVLEDGPNRLEITVLAETKKIDGVEARVVEERETKNGKPVEISRNFFAISSRTNSVYYFGEEVDEYKNGKVSGHPGGWRSGVNGAKFGLIMPGLNLLGSKYYQEVAPGVALDRAEIMSTNETVKTGSQEFKNCIKLKETTPLEPEVVEYKFYAPGIGLVQDEALLLTDHGKQAK